MNFFIILFRFDLELFDHLCGDIVISVVQNKIRSHIENTSLDNYQESFIKSFEEVWVQVFNYWHHLCTSYYFFFYRLSVKNLLENLFVQYFILLVGVSVDFLVIIRLQNCLQNTKLFEQI